MPVPFVDLRAQHAAVADDVASSWSGVLERCDFVLGGEVEEFEREFAAYCEAPHAVGVDSGTSALELAFRALGIGPGDEVITAANTFVATAFAISHAGATPVLADVDPETLTLDPERVEAAITPRTRAIAPVHLYGHPAPMDPLMNIARRHGLVVVEDAAQAHGALYRGRRVGSIGDAAAFSFFPAKNLGCYGDGGAVVTGDAAVADRVRHLRNYGQPRKYHHDLIGYNRRLDTLQAAVLRANLRRLDGWNASRRAAAADYAATLADAAVRLPAPADDVEPVWHLFVVQSDDRDGLAARLASLGVASGIHYPVPVHLQRAYKGALPPEGAFPVTERAARRILSLPMFPGLDAEAVSHVAAGIRSWDRPGSGAAEAGQAVGARRR
jgi:dTDP-4-amino-4,6-dideoxygalactose transaminase